MNEQEQHTYLLQFFRWVIPIIFLFNLAFAAMYMLTFHFQFIWNSLVSFISGCALLVAKALLIRGRFFQAVIVTFAILLLLALVGTVALPQLTAVNSLLPFIAAIIAVQYLHGRILPILLVICWVTIMVLQLVAIVVPIQTILSPMFQLGALLSSYATVIGVLLLLLWQMSTRSNSIVEQLRAANSQLHVAQGELENQITARTSDLQQALQDLRQRADAQTQLLEQVEEQRVVIRELSVPVIPVNRQTLVMPLIGSFDTQRLQDVQEEALNAIKRTGAQQLIIDITGVPVVDSYVAQGILMVVQSARLLGAETVLVGIRPEVAQAIVGLGITLPGLRTASSLQDVLASLPARME